MLPVVESSQTSFKFLLSGRKTLFSCSSKNLDCITLYINGRSNVFEKNEN